MSGNPSILIQARLNAAQAEQTTNAQLKQLQAKLDPLQLKIDSASVSQQFKILENGTQKLTQSIHSASDAYGNQYKIIQQINKTTKEMDITQVKLVKNNKQMIADKTAELRLTQQLQNTYNKQMFSNFNSSIGIGNVAKSAKESASAFEDLFAKSDKTTAGLSKVEKQTAKLNPVMKDLGVTTEKSAQSMSSVFGKILIWSALTTALFFPISMLREGLVVLKELDSAMVEIAKVTDLSAGALDRLKKSSFDAASAYGRTAQDFLSSVAVFSRAGYDTMASGLAEISLLAQNVGELTSDQADAFLLATDAAYKYKGSQEELGKVLDGVNQIDKLYCPVY